MSLAISGFIALILLFMHRYFVAVKGSSDPFMGIASAMFWFLFAGSGAVVSAMDVTNIYFYFFFFGIGMAIATLVSALNFSPTQETKEEKQEGKQASGGMAGMREKMGWRQLRRRN